MTAMTLPPLLREHIELLRSQGYTIEVVDGGEIGIIFKDYSIPGHIWNRDKVDILITTHPTYPNAKLDMFWVDPAVALKNNGAQPKSTSPESKFGRSWQRFSWHINNWNPAHENLITYLGMVEDRLHKVE